MIDQLNVQIIFQKTRISLQGKFERLGFWDLHSLTLRPCVEKDRRGMAFDWFKYKVYL